MAILKSPLLSLKASGSIGDAITYARVKGLHVAKLHSKPTDPKTPLQLANRTNITLAMYAWRNFITDEFQRPGWYLYAKILKSRATGYSAFIASCLKVMQETDLPVFADSATTSPGCKVSWWPRDMNTGEWGKEPGTFDIWAGPDDNHMTYRESVGYDPWLITSNSLGTPGDTISCMIFKGGNPRSGITRELLLA